MELETFYQYNCQSDEKRLERTHLFQRMPQAPYALLKENLQFLMFLNLLNVPVVTILHVDS